MNCRMYRWWLIFCNHLTLLKCVLIWIVSPVGSLNLRYLSNGTDSWELDFGCWFGNYRHGCFQTNGEVWKACVRVLFVLLLTLYSSASKYACLMIRIAFVWHLNDLVSGLLLLENLFLPNLVQVFVLLQFLCGLQRILGVQLVRH